METILVDASAIFSMTACGSSGANRYSTIEPTILGSHEPSGSLSTRVYRQSCFCIVCCILRSNVMTPTPQMPQFNAFPSFIRRSRYIAWWARWNPPTPKWTTPVVTAER